MEEINIKIPEELKELGSISKINWQLAINKMLKEKFERVERVKRILDKSKITDEKAKELADEVNIALAKRYEKLLKK